jgi:hypothetical protein
MALNLPKAVRRYGQDVVEGEKRRVKMTTVALIIVAGYLLDQIDDSAPQCGAFYLHEGFRKR